MLRSIITLAFAVVLASCANKQPIVSVPKPTVKSIAIVPATNPTAYTLGNHNGAIGLFIPGAVFIAYAVENRAKAKVLTEKVSALPFSPGMEFTNAMAAGLRDRGYTVQILENLARVPGDPDSIDFEKLDYSADAVLHLYFSEIGIYSPPWSINYVPRVNATGIVFVKGHRDYLYEETIYFGADAREGKKWAITADEKFAYPNFDFVLNNLESVKGGFSTGVREVAKRMAEQIHAAVK